VTFLCYLSLYYSNLLAIPCGRLTRVRSFVSRNGGRQSGPQDRERINGPLMFQYLLAMLSQPGRTGPIPEFFEGMTPGSTEAGRFGDYVFNQEGAPLLARSMRHRVLTAMNFMHSFGSDHHTAYGEFCCASCAGHRGDRAEAAARGPRGRM
jgi:hypothetical protein